MFHQHSVYNYLKLKWHTLLDLCLLKWIKSLYLKMYLNVKDSKIVDKRVKPRSLKDFAEV